MKKILLLTDFSKDSMNAIYYGLNLYRTESCAFFLLHVKSSRTYITDDLIASANQSINSALFKDAENELANLVTELKEAFKSESYTYEVIIDFDILTDSINQVIKSKNIEFIVMGSNGVTGAKEILFGSNTINVIRKVNCTTLVVPRDYKFNKPKAVLLPLDSFDSLGGEAFTSIANFIQKTQSTMHILRINPDGIAPSTQHKDLEHMKYSLKDIPYHYNVVEHVSMYQAVSTYIQTQGINFMMLLQQDELLFERFFMSSPTKKIGNHLLVPLLVFHT